jgi:pimeloyl-ACP methyl ester carboxylesterase
MRRIVVRVLFGLLVLVGTAAATGLALRAVRQHQISASRVIRSPRGINESRFVRIGGVDQWISIRGEDRDNPVLLNLHGGPGLALDTLPREWESRFTVVQWDQRGAGRTYIRNPKPAADLNIGQMTADGLVVAEYVRVRLHKTKVVLIANSWGTVLGLSMVKARPGLFSAYVGAGNLTDPQAMELWTHSALFAMARAKGDAKMVSALQKMGAPPWTSSQLDVQRAIASGNGPRSDRSAIAGLIGALLVEPGYSLGDVQQYLTGMRESITWLAPQAEAWKAQRLGADFDVPMVFIQGRDDLVTPTAVVRGYVEGIRAPRKMLLVVPEAGHLVLRSHPDSVMRLLLIGVRPLSVAADRLSAQGASPPAKR